MSILDVCSKASFGAEPAMQIPFIGEGNIWIQNTYDANVLDLARSLIRSALNGTAPGQLTVTCFDSDYSGVFAPFAALSSGANKTFEFVPDFRALENHLDYLGTHIQAVQNVIQGREESLTAFRRSINRPVEGYRLVVLFMNFSDVETKFLAKLSTLMQRGPAAGVSFLIVPANNKIAGDRKPQHLDEHVAFLYADEGKVARLNAAEDPIGFGRYATSSASEIIADCERFGAAIRSAQMPTVHFSEVADTEKIWDKSSADGLTFSVGKYGVNTIEVTIGDELNQRHNALITGAVGQGKSNLISVILHSLCLRYAPEELELYLLDFKEGVSLKPFCASGKEDYLPHAKVVGLESDIDLGLSVLEHLYSVYLERLKLFKELNVRSLYELRRTYPHMKMPRILAVIDEFQLMFGEDMNFGQKTVDLLEKSVRLFRAAGIHFILASQSVSGSMILSGKKDSLFSQVPIRISLKNSVSESQNTLGIGNMAAAYLRSREAIVNVDYGEISQNRKTIVAYAEPNTCGNLVRSWWENAKDRSAPPYVFESDKRTPATAAAEDALTCTASTKGIDGVPIALLGERISIGGAKTGIPLPNEAGRNIAILGSPEPEYNAAEALIESIALSLAAQSGGNARFLLCDFRGDKGAQACEKLTKALSTCGAELEMIPTAAFAHTLGTLLSHSGEKKTYVFALSLDRWAYEKDPYGGAPLKEFVDAAPEKGIHLIAWWVKPSKFKAQVSGFESSDAFNTKVFLRLDEGSVRSITNNPFVKWDAPAHRVLVSDAVELESELVCIPYAPL